MYDEALCYIGVLQYSRVNKPIDALLKIGDKLVHKVYDHFAQPSASVIEESTANGMCYNQYDHSINDVPSKY